MIPPALLLGHKDLLLLPGTVVSRSATVAAREFLVPGKAVEPGAAAVTIRGKNIVLDFQGATLRGSAATVDPDRRPGVGLLVEGENVTIKNAKVRGYKVALWARNCKNLKIVDCDLSYNWRQRLKSTREKEDLDDWMSYHHNEANEWLRYGAAAYLEGCLAPELRGVRATGGENGVMMTRTSGGLVWNCDLSYNSGIGIGMYRSSNNRVMHNAVNFCVRGHSEGFYNRGQDSAAILVYEGSNRNLFAYNSATHSGDGFFLWAGQTTMDTGQGGCNDNLIYGNDFSFAPTNAIEATFSRNTFANNKLWGAWHGVWGGYSYDTKILGNDFQRNEEDIAIEHGQRITIEGNRMFGAKRAIHLWQNATQDPNWGYPKHHETDSIATTVRGNSIGASLFHLDLKDAKRVIVEGNRFYGAIGRREGDTSGFVFRNNEVLGTVKDLPEEGNRVQDEPVQTMESTWDPYAGDSDRVDDLSRSRNPARALEPKALAGGKWPFDWTRALSSGNRRGEIRMTEWGPYDERSPLVWPSVKPDSNGREKFALFGPKGRFRVVSSKGVRLSANRGAWPGSIVVDRIAEEPRREIVFEYVGKATTDLRGVTTPAGRPVRFRWSEFVPTMAWDVAFAKWDPATQDPRKVDVAPLFSAPLLAMKSRSLDFAGYGAFAPGVPATHFATRADGSFTVPTGKYVIEITGDDGIRLDLDGRRLVDEWHYQGPTTYRTPPLALAGAHRLRVEHFQIDGYAALRVRIIPV